MNPSPEALAFFLGYSRATSLRTMESAAEIKPRHDPLGNQCTPLIRQSSHHSDGDPILQTPRTQPHLHFQSAIPSWNPNHYRVLCSINASPETQRLLPPSPQLRGSDNPNLPLKLRTHRSQIRRCTLASARSQARSQCCLPVPSHAYFTHRRRRFREPTSPSLSLIPVSLMRRRTK